MFSHILLAYDGSENAKRAMNVAIDLAKRYNALLEVVEVVDTAALASVGFAPIPSEVFDSLYKKAQSDVNEVVEKASKENIKVKGTVLEGDPAGTILDYANKNNVDLIVTGSRGLSTLKRLFLGSVSTRIVTEAKMPVLVVK
ncbi:MAG: universal stress protein [Sulfolobaceae archaeon]|nr:universal stress protein [Sulfolobaceae archaeon]